MPVIFKTPTSHSVLMLDKDAELMISAMETSGNIPGALFPEYIADSLDSLIKKVKIESDNEIPDQDDDSNHVSINNKALPLIELMKTAIENNEKLLWDKG